MAKRCECGGDAVERRLGRRLLIPKQQVQRQGTNLARDGHPKGRHIRISCVSKPQDIVSPSHESSAPLIEVGVAVVDRGDPADDALLVVQNAIGDVPIDAELRHPIGRGAPEPLASEILYRSHERTTIAQPFNSDARQ
jgi:hypothetical protein